MAAIDLDNPNVSENPDVDQIVGYLSVIGGQADEHFTFTLINNAGERFQIETFDVIDSYLTVKTATLNGNSLFDYENNTLNHFAVTISAQGDKGTAVAATSFTIDVYDVGEQPTDLSLSNASIAEHSPTGTVVGLLSAADPDQNETFTYALLDDAGGRFKLDQTGTKLVVADGAKLDFVTSNSHQVVIEVYDSFGVSQEKTFTIDVTDVADTTSGTAKSEFLVGTTGKDIIQGGPGNDKIFSLSGDDIINGGSGKDFLAGGTGKDIFVFDTPIKKGQFDQIADFSPADDTLQFKLAALKPFKIKGLKHGKLDKKFFAVGDHAKDKNDYVYYNKKSGFVYLDNDGSGSNKEIQIVKIKPGLHLTASDFLFV